MSKQEFKETIEYKTYKTQIRHIATATIVVNALYWMIGIVTFVYFYINTYKSVAVAVLCSLIGLGLFVSIVPICGLFFLHSRFSPIYDYLDNLYIFEYRLKKSIDNKYEISFEYEREKLDIISSDLGNDELDNKLVRVGYIKELDRVIILERISR